MPINYNLGRSAPRPQSQYQPPAMNRYALTRQAPLSQNAQLADDQNLQGLKTGQFADVESARGATDRANALRSSSSLQAARGTIARSGEMSPEAAIRAQDQAFSSAEAQNLNASNGVNQLQRQYRTDALNRADTIENRDQTNANNERAYQTNRDDEQYNRFGLERANAQQQQQQGIANSQWDKNFGANREDAATQKDQFGQTLAQRTKEFGVTSDQNQQGINNQKDQFGQSLADSRSRFDLSRGDANSQFDQNLANNKNQFNVTSGQSQQQINNQASQFGQNYAAGREDAATQKDQFGQTLNDSRSRFDLSRADANNQFDQTFGANRADVAYGQQYQAGRDQVGDTRYNQQYADQRGDINYDRSQATRLEGKGDALAAINAIQDPKAKQAAYNAYMNGEDVSQFITGTLYGGSDNGTLNKDYASASPGTQAYQAKIDELKSYNPGKSDAEIEQMAQTERTQDRSISRAPAGAASQQMADTDLRKKLALGQTLSPDEEQSAIANGVIPQSTPTTLPTGSDVQDFLQKNPSGKVAIGGQVYTVLGGDRIKTGTSDWGGTEHLDYTTVLDPSGAKKYVWRGQIQNDPPKE